MCSKREISLRASVRFLTQEEGGRFTDPQSGYRPQIKFEEIQASCIVQPVQERPVLERGKDIEVVITPMFYEEVKEKIGRTINFDMFEGSHLIGTGRFLADGEDCE